MVAASCRYFDSMDMGKITTVESIVVQEEVVEEDGLEEILEKEVPEVEVSEEIPIKLWIEDIIPGDIKTRVKTYIDNLDDIELVQEKQDAEVLLEIVPAGGINSSGITSKALNISYVAALGTSFFNLTDGLAWDDFKSWWSGDNQALAYISQEGVMPVLALKERDMKILEKIMGETGNKNIQVIDEPGLLEGFEDDSVTFSFVPFDGIEKELKIFEISGLSVFDRELVLGDYPFAFSVILSGEDKTVVDQAYSLIKDMSYTNRDLSKLTSLIMTGVTAMVRGTAQRMEKYGITYPGEKIADILKNADITHISNEVPFKEGCEVLVDRFPFFCSKPEYIELLEYVGTDVIELTGNHMNDQGHDWFIYTLEMYDEKGWPYFGGGRDLEESYSPAILESNGNRFAFLGFCWWGPAYDWATEDTPGSAPPHFEEFESIIKGLKEDGYIVIFTFQYLESYQYDPVEQQVTDFRRMIDAGADIVSGSQSHHPQGMEFYQKGFISYGLGNLFFDQMRVLGTRQELITKHIFYEGNHINTVIITAMLEDYSQPRLASPQERADILTEVFNASIK